MTLQLLPVPVEYAERLRVYWGPFLEEIADRGLQTVEEMTSDVLDGRMTVLLAWDSENVRAQALAGVELLKDARGRLWCHLVWCTGQGMPQWFGLLDEVEQWARESFGCVAIRATCRTGWTRPLKAKGYSMTHTVMEKEFQA